MAGDRCDQAPRPALHPRRAQPRLIGRERRASTGQRPQAARTAGRDRGGSWPGPRLARREGQAAARLRDGRRLGPGALPSPLVGPPGPPGEGAADVPGHLPRGAPPLVAPRVRAGARLGVEPQPARCVDRRGRPAGQPGRPGDAAPRRRRLDLPRHDARAAGPRPAPAHDLAGGLPPARWGRAPAAAVPRGRRPPARGSCGGRPRPPGPAWWRSSTGRSPPPPGRRPGARGPRRSRWARPRRRPGRPARRAAEAAGPGRPGWRAGSR